MHSNFQGVIITPLAIGVNLTPYSRVFFYFGGGGEFFFLNSKKEFNELFFRSKNHPGYLGVKKSQKRTYPVPKIFTPLEQS